jgi:hypothetical protein
MSIFHLLLFSFLSVISGSAVDNLQPDALESLELTFPKIQEGPFLINNHLSQNKHLALGNYLEKQNLIELFVRNLFIDGKNWGPVYYNLRPKTSEWIVRDTVYFVTRLDFGTVSQYSSLDVNDKDAVLEMKQDLVKKSIFNWSSVMVEHVIVNGVDYQSFYFGCLVE